MLVDTGSEVNLVRRGLINPFYFTNPLDTLVLTAANQLGLGGNHREVHCEVLLKATDVESKKIPQSCLTLGGI